jgi:hypothetical protein
MIWNYLLIIAVSTQVLLIAYIYHPKWKAFIYTLPLPFTFIALSVGQQLSAVNMLSMFWGLVYIQVVRILYIHFKLPIALSIIVAVALYNGLGYLTNLVVPTSEIWFFIAAIFVFIAGLLLKKIVPHKEEPGDRTHLPLWLKLPLTVVLVIGVVYIKQWLGGAISFFPLVGVFLAYEARKSLWTMGKGSIAFLVTMTPMLVATHIMYNFVGLGIALVIGWIVFFISKWLNKQTAI